jgi:hypothetical protein
LVVSAAVVVIVVEMLVEGRNEVRWWFKARALYARRRVDVLLTCTCAPPKREFDDHDRSVARAHPTTTQAIYVLV